MIVRVMHDRQYEVPASAVGRLEELDLELDRALTGGDAAAFATALETLVAQVRSSGTPVPVETIIPSDRTVPAPGTTIAELRALLASEPAAGTEAADVRGQSRS